MSFQSNKAKTRVISGNLLHLKRNDVPLTLAELNANKPDLLALALILLKVALLF